MSMRTREHTHTVCRKLGTPMVRNLELPGTSRDVSSWYPSRKHGFGVEDFVDLKGLKHVDPREEPAQAQLIKS